MVNIRTLAIIVCLFSSQWAGGQSFDIDVTMDIPMPNTLAWDDIWNVTIDSKIANPMMPTTVDISVELNLDGVIYSATTEKFIVPLGLTYLNAAIAKTKNSTVHVEDPTYQSFYTQYNEMVDGTYQMCVTLNLYDPLGTIMYTATNCIFHDVSHAGIIILTTPLNGDTVESELLQFNWTHVTQRVQLLDPYYVLDLVNVIDEQSPNTAISVNPKRLSVAQLREPYLDYPQIERELDTGQVYAWRVIAYTETRSTTRDKLGQNLINLSGGSFQEIGRSEVGYFVCGSPENQKERKLRSQKTNYFIDLQHQSANQTYFFTTSLPLSMNNSYASRSLKFQLFDEEHNVIDLTHPPIALEPGLNNFTIDLSSDEIKAEHYYFAEFGLSDGEVIRLKLYKRKEN